MEQAQDIALIVVMVIGILFLVGLLYFLMRLMGISLQRAEQALRQMDANPAVLAVGQSLPGRTINEGLRGLVPRVDEASDPFIQQILHLPILRQMHQAGLINGEELSRLAAGTLQNAILLTNGIPDVSFSLLSPIAEDPNQVG